MMEEMRDRFMITDYYYLLIFVVEGGIKVINWLITENVLFKTNKK